MRDHGVVIHRNKSWSSRPEPIDQAPVKETTVVPAGTTRRVPEAARLGKLVVGAPFRVLNTRWPVDSRYPARVPLRSTSQTTPPAMTGGPGFLPVTDQRVVSRGRAPVLIWTARRLW